MALLSTEYVGQELSNEAESTPQNGNQMLLPEGLRSVMKSRSVVFDQMTGNGMTVKAVKSVVTGLPVER